MHTSLPKRAGLRLGALFLVAALAACSGSPQFEAAYPPDDRPRGMESGSIFGGDGLVVGLGRDRNDSGAAPGIGVNSFLWRASLDTVSFMPVASADPFGGVILTDWYSPPDTPNERFKINIYILDRTLRADGVRVSVFRQVRDGEGGWRDAPVSAETATKLEDTILTRARQLRIAQIGNT